MRRALVVAWLAVWPFLLVAAYTAWALLLGGCAAPQVIERQVPVRVPVEVRVNVPVPCVGAEDIPAAPAARSDAELDGLTDYQLVLAIEQQRRELRLYEQRAAALITRCTKPNVSLRGATP